MRIAISTDGNAVSPHFGRCPAFTVVEVVEGKAVGQAESSRTPVTSRGSSPGSFTKRGQSIVTGGMGAGPRHCSRNSGMETVLGVGGHVDEVIERFLRRAV